MIDHPPPVKPQKDPKREAIGRALCLFLGCNPDKVERGVTGHYWITWDSIMIHAGKRFLEYLDSAGYEIRKKE